MADLHSIAWQIICYLHGIYFCKKHIHLCKHEVGSSSLCSHIIPHGKINHILMVTLLMLSLQIWPLHIVILQNSINHPCCYLAMANSPISFISTSICYTGGVLGGCLLEGGRANICYFSSYARDLPCPNPSILPKVTSPIMYYNVMANICQFSWQNPQPCMNLLPLKFTCQITYIFSPR